MSATSYSGRAHRLVAGSTLLVALLIVSALPGEAAAPARDRVVVTFADQAARAAALSDTGLRTRADGAASASSLGRRVAVLDLTSAQRAALANEPGVVAVEPDVAMHADLVPTDPVWSYQNGARDIDADDAWDVTTGAAGVVVAIVDTGVDPGDPDLQGRLTQGYDFVNGDADTTDDNGHGTAAATIAGAAGNLHGIAGMCWDCRVMPLKALDADGSGFLSDAALAVSWAVDHGADVINMSLGAGGTTSALSAALAQAEAAGVLVVASAGNDGTTAKQWPAADPRAVSVAALDGTSRASYSNYGDWVDVAAPGCNPASGRNNTFINFCGTSSSAPLVSGAAALALSVTPTASLDEQRTALTTTATPLAAGLGAGRIDTEAAIAALAAGAPPAQDPSGGGGRGTPPATDPDPSPSPAPIPTPDPEPEDPENPEDPEDAPPAPSFSDIGDLVHRGAIEKLADSGITAGCRDGRYCPDRRVTRGQIATFLDRGLDLPDGDASFGDVPAGHPHAAGIAAVARADITNGCAANRFCPDAVVDRAQMASFLVRALDL